MNEHRQISRRLYLSSGRFSIIKNNYIWFISLILKKIRNCCMIRRMRLPNTCTYVLRIQLGMYVICIMKKMSETRWCLHRHTYFLSILICLRPSQWFFCQIHWVYDRFDNYNVNLFIFEWIRSGCVYHCLLMFSKNNW